MNFFKRKRSAPPKKFDGTVAVRFARGGVFAPGEVVSGQLIWKKDHPCSLKLITAHLFGYVSAPIFHPERVVANTQVKTVYRPPESKAPVPKGDTIVEFAMHGLNVTAPNSFSWEGEGVKVEYFLTFTLVMKRGAQNVVFKAPFLVLKPQPDLRPSGPVASKSPNQFLNPSNKIEFSCKPFHPVLNPGMQMLFNISITNRSFKDVHSLTISLVQIYQLGQTKQKRTSHQVTFSADPEFPIPGLRKGVDPSSSVGFTSQHSFPFSVPPPELPSSFCWHQVRVSYELCFSLLVNKKHWAIPWKTTIRQFDDITLREQFGHGPSSASSSALDSPRTRMRSGSSPATLAPGPSASSSDPALHRPAPPPPSQHGYFEYPPQLYPPPPGYMYPSPPYPHQASPLPPHYYYAPPPQHFSPHHHLHHSAPHPLYPPLDPNNSTIHPPHSPTIHPPHSPAIHPPHSPQHFQAPPLYPYSPPGYYSLQPQDHSWSPPVPADFSDEFMPSAPCASDLPPFPKEFDEPVVHSS